MSLLTVTMCCTKLVEKSHTLNGLKVPVKLPPMLMATRWNSWFNVAEYHSSFLQFYEGFFKQEKTYSLAVDRILELVGDNQLHHISYHNFQLNLHFINENCTCLIIGLRRLEENKSLFACVVYNMMEDVKQNLHTGTSK